jgi:hypothetical protein
LVRINFETSYCTIRTYACAYSNSSTPKKLAPNE